MTIKDATPRAIQMLRFFDLEFGLCRTAKRKLAKALL